jgi:hypothetical protein
MCTKCSLRLQQDQDRKKTSSSLLGQSPGLSSQAPAPCACPLSVVLASEHRDRDWTKKTTKARRLGEVHRKNRQSSGGTEQQR